MTKPGSEQSLRERAKRELVAALCSMAERYAIQGSAAIPGGVAFSFRDLSIEIETNPDGAINVAAPESAGSLAIVWNATSGEYESVEDGAPGRSALLVLSDAIEHAMSEEKPRATPRKKQRPPRAAARPAPVPAGLSSATLFKKLWSALVDLLGNAATAAVVGRASRRAQQRSPELRELVIARSETDFNYVLPRSFDREGPMAAMVDLLHELWLLLFDQTGWVALLRLQQVPELRDWATTQPTLIRG